jgi:hypothetical protein
MTIADVILLRPRLLASVNQIIYSVVEMGTGGLREQVIRAGARASAKTIDLPKVADLSGPMTNRALFFAPNHGNQARHGDHGAKSNQPELIQRRGVDGGSRRSCQCLIADGKNRRHTHCDTKQAIRTDFHVQTP